MKTIVLLTLLIPLTAFSRTETETELTTVDSVDLERYLGVWYEVAQIPNRFQKQCVKNTTAEYSLKEKGKIRVVNRCTNKDGEIETVEGTAKVVDKATNARLKVSFVSILGINLFWGDYWIIGLDAEYKWAIVGTPSRKYGWILSRTSELTDVQWEQINGILTEKGYDTERFVRTEQGVDNE